MDLHGVVSIAGHSNDQLEMTLHGNLDLFYSYKKSNQIIYRQVIRVYN